MNREERARLARKKIRQKRKRRRRMRIFVFWVLLLLLLFYGIKFVWGVFKKEVPLPILNKIEALNPFSDSSADEWFLILVNQTHALGEDYKPETAELSNGLLVDKRIYDELTEMINDAKKDGLTLIPCSAYRSVERQKVLYVQETQKWISQGYSQEEAAAKAATIVAPPGQSEHNLGLAVDFGSAENQSLEEDFKDTPEGVWLKENSAKYGFVLRYPEDKSDITGIIYEPWHYRYVGKKNAEKMNELSMCLEEYVEYLGQS